MKSATEAIIEGLPKVEALFLLLQRSDKDTVTKQELIALKDEFLVIAQKVVTDYRLYTKDTLVDTYSELVAGLVEFDFTVGAMIGIGKAIMGRLLGKSYEELTKDTLTSTDKTKKMSQGDREKMAEYQIEVIKGMVELLKKTDANIQARTFAFKEDKGY